MKAIRASSLAALLWLSPAHAQDEGTLKKWPVAITGSKDLGKYKLSETAEGFLYETQNYRVRIPKKIDSSLVTNFVISAESVAFALKSIPLPLFTLASDEKPLIEISLDEKSYLAVGGVRGTAGFFNGRTKKINIQWEYLNQVPARSQLLPRPAFDLLVHELTHLCMHGSLWKMESWLVEGVAEYLAAAHLKEGHFKFNQIDSQIRDHIRSRTGNDGQKIRLTSLKKLVEFSPRAWLQHVAEVSPEKALEPYTSALLLTHYYFHGGQQRRQEIQKHLEELEQVTFSRDPKPKLLSSTEAAALEKKLTSYWSTRGLQLIFHEQSRFHLKSDQRNPQKAP